LRIATTDADNIEVRNPIGERFRRASSLLPMLARAVQ
jgi:hypothetical protein